MTRSMHSAIAAAAIVLTWSAHAAAHRLDECLQATRIALSRHAIDIEVDVTPGSDIADAFVAAVDLDRDGHISAGEAAAYAARVAHDLHLTIDGRDVPVTLGVRRVGDLAAMRDGLDAIKLAGSIPLGSDGR